MGSEGSRLAESERGVWFWLKIYSICTPLFKRKNELVLFRGRKTVSAPKFWSPGWDLHERAPNGELQPNPRKFPKGIKAVADYVKGLGDGPFRS